MRVAEGAFISGKKKMNTIRLTKICDGHGQTLRDGTFRPGRQHDQTALQTDGIDDLLQRFPDVTCGMDAGYRGLARVRPRPPPGNPPPPTPSPEQPRQRRPEGYCAPTRKAPVSALARYEALTLARCWSCAGPDLRGYR